MYKNHYGSDYVAAAYCGLKIPPRPARGLWMHGWVPKPLVGIPEDLFGTTIPDNKTALFVANYWERDFLLSSGYPNAHAIGLPACYVQSQGGQMRRQSLLVMPAHSIEGMNTGHLPTKEYASYIKSISDRFSTVQICLYHFDYKQHIWRAEFEKLGLTCIMGADHMLPQALSDQHRMFSQFEFMTTNSEGSHVAYAAAAGLKVSIAGPMVCWRAENLEHLPFYRQYPKALLTWRDNDEAAVRRRLGRFFTEPHLANESISWGEEQIGTNHRRSPGDLKRLFGWSVADAMLMSFKKFVPLPVTLRRRIDEYFL
jgi:hypothetical protein